MTDLPADNERDFAAWLRAMAANAGYRFDGPRAGGLSRLAEDAGVTISVISRALAGERMPDLQTLRSLARPLRTNLREMLIESGQADENDLPSSTTVGSVASLTDNELAVLDREVAALERRVEEARATLLEAQGERDEALHRLRVAEARAAQAAYRVEAHSAELMELHMRVYGARQRNARK